MAILPYKVLARLVPWDMFDPGLGGRELAFALRASVPGNVILMLHILCFILPFMFISMSFLNEKNNAVKYMYVTIFMFSGVMLYSLERGNIVVYAFLFTFLFVYLIERTEHKWIAYICLVLAASIKLYPAVFGLILLGKKGVKSILFAVAGFFLLFCIAYRLGGLGNIKGYVSNIIRWTQSLTMTPLGTNFSFKNFLLVFNKLLYRILIGRGGYFAVPQLVFMVSKLLLLAGGIFSYFHSDSEWKKLASLSLMCILIPDVSYLYVLLFLFIPIVSFLNDETEGILPDFYALCFGTIMPVLVIPVKVDFPRYFVSGGFLLQFFALVLLWLFINIQAIVHCAQNMRGKRKR